MKNIRVLLIPVFLFFLCSLSVKAQTPHSFEYDDSGNRTSRNILLLKSAVAQGEDALANQVTLNDLIGEREIKIYPNPTKGQLKIEIPNTEESPAVLSIYSMTGALVKSTKATSMITAIELSNQPPGVYNLVIQIGENSTKWKIIKD